MNKVLRVQSFGMEGGGVQYINICDFDYYLGIVYV